MDLRKRHHEIYIVVILIVVIAGIALDQRKTTGNIVAWEPVSVTIENLPVFLSSLELTQDLPKKSSIHVKFGDLDYVATKGNVVRGLPENPDIVVTLPEKYIAIIGYGPCSAIREAIRNNELGIETSLSRSQLLWKYKGMLKYRKCAGF